MEVAVLLAVVCVGYNPLFQGLWEFVHNWDDGGNFYENPAVQGLSGDHLWAMATTTYVNVYEPLSFLEKAVAIATFSDDELPRAYRIAALAFHTGACYMLYCCTTRLLLLCASGSRAAHNCNDSTWAFRVRLAALFATALYAVSPLNVEVMGWASAGPYAPSAFFVLAACRSYLAGVKELQPPTVHLTSATLWLYVLAMLHKSIALPLPVALVALDFALRGGRTGPTSPLAFVGFVGRALVRKLPLLAATAGFAVPMFVGNDHDEGFASDIDVESLSLSRRLVLACIRWWGYLLQAVLPFGLRPHYRIRTGMLDMPFSGPEPPQQDGVQDELWRLVQPQPGNAWMPHAEPLFAMVATVLLVAWLWRARDAYPAVVSAAGFYTIMLAPMIGIVQHGMVQLLGDRYAYLPLTAAVPLLAYGLLCGMRTASDRRWMSVVAAAAIAVSCVLCSIQIGRWRSCETLWTYSVRVDPTDWRMHSVMAEYRNTLSQPNAFRYHMSMEMEFSPPATGGIKPALSRGRAYFLIGENAAACKVFEWGQTRWPEAGEFYSNLGVCALQQGRVDDARALFHKGAELLPSRESVVNNVLAMAEYDRDGVFHGAFVY